jgi:hypothetical protein
LRASARARISAKGVMSASILAIWRAWHAPVADATARKLRDHPNPILMLDSFNLKELNEYIHTCAKNM